MREAGDLVAAAFQAVEQQRRQARADGEFGAQRGDVVVGERHVGAVRRPAVAEVWADGAAGVAVLLAECLVRLEDAGGEGAGIDRWVGAAHEALESARVGEDDAGETRLRTEMVEPTGRFGGGWSGEVGVFVGVDHGQEVFAAGEGLFGFDLGAEPGVGGPK